MPAEPLNLLDYEPLARERLSATAYDYFAGGADDGVTLHANREAFGRWRLRPRVLAGVGQRDLSLDLLGRRLDWPVLIAPTAFARLADPDGELAIARAAAASPGPGTLQVLSTLSTTPLEDVAAVAPPWFQLYVFRDRELTRTLVERAEAAGCAALVLTVDAPLLGRREADARNRFSLPEGIVAANLPASAPPEAREVRSSGSESGLLEYFASQIDPSLDWGDLEWLCRETALPVLVKGILRDDDAQRAVDHGAAGVIVSNHGGRQLDGAVATLDALPEVAAAVASEVPVLLDGGVRRGTDVVKALALGARAVLVGRPVLWALAAGGEEGVRHALTLLREEVDRALALAGARTLEEVTPDLVRRAP